MSRLCWSMNPSIVLKKLRITQTNCSATVALLCKCLSFQPNWRDDQISLFVTYCFFQCCMICSLCFQSQRGVDGRDGLISSVVCQLLRVAWTTVFTKFVVLKNGTTWSLRLWVNCWVKDSGFTKDCNCCSFLGPLTAVRLFGYCVHTKLCCFVAKTG